jgi:hypothetical protein
MDGDQAAFLSRKDIRVAQMALLDFHGGVPYSFLWWRKQAVLIPVKVR